MKKIISSILAILVLGVVIFMACSKENSETGEKVNTLKSADIMSTINDLLIIRDSIGKIAFEKKIPVSELKSAYENNDTLKIQQLLGLTDIDI